MKTAARLLVCLLIPGLAGCVPEERFWWAPDGTRAAAVVNEQLHLVRADGDLGAPLFSGAETSATTAKHVCWLPDGRGMVLHRVRKFATWDEARAVIPSEESSRIERLASALPSLLTAAAPLVEDADSLATLLTRVVARDQELAAAAFFCAYEKQQAAVEAALLTAPDGAAMVESIRREAPHLSVHEICLLRLRDDRIEGEPRTLVRSVHSLLLPAVSPKFSAVAYWRVLGEEEKLALEVCALDGPAKIEVARTSSASFGWTPDGRSLVFAVPAAGDDALLQTIQQVKVLDDSGALLKPRSNGEVAPGEIAPPADLALAILPSPARLAVLPDGRVLFASVPATLPAASSGMNPDPRLFLISADDRSVKAVPTAPGDLPTNLSFFVASPDGKRVAVVESDTDAVAVVELATGRTEIVSPAHPQWQCRTLPQWKSATELTFAALDGPQTEPRWMLWTQAAGVRTINARWPATATRDWLSRKKHEEGEKVAPKKTP